MNETHKVGIMHRPAAPYRPAIAVYPDHVDVARTRGDTLLQNAGALVDHREDHALDDLLLRDRPSVDAEPGRPLENDFFDLRIGNRRARARIIAKISLPGLLAVMPGLAERIFDLVALA